MDGNSDVTSDLTSTSPQPRKEEEMGHRVLFSSAALALAMAIAAPEGFNNANHAAQRYS
jgi:hypothetical protein